jgi:GAF domain-containing protein
MTEYAALDRNGPIEANPDDETARLATLMRYDILDSPPEPQFDRVVELARVLFDTPISTVTLVDRDRQWFKARAGIAASQTPRDQSFCSRAIEGNDLLVVPDAQSDPRFADNPLVTGEPHIRFYAGAPLRAADGHNIGTVCVISPEPRHDFSEDDHRKLRVLASIVSTGMELRARERGAKTALHEQAATLREANLRIKSSLEYATLLAEVQSEDMPTEKLAAVALAAWRQHEEAGGILTVAIKSLRDRMPAPEYRALLDSMPGFGL